MRSLFEEMKEAILDELPTALCTVISKQNRGRKLLVRGDGTVRGSLGSDEWNDRARGEALQLLRQQKCGRTQLSPDSHPVDLFIDVFVPAPRLFIIGAVHVAIPLVFFARELGFRTTIVDPRPIFASPDRFPHADRLLRAWPTDALSVEELDESSYLAVLSHDERLDIPVLQMALESRCPYIGVLGSRKTRARRIAALQEMGVTPEQLRRLHFPIGLDLGARNPEEIALAIIAEMVAVKNSRPPAD